MKLAYFRVDVVGTFFGPLPADNPSISENGVLVQIQTFYDEGSFNIQVAVTAVTFDPAVAGQPPQHAVTLPDGQTEFISDYFWSVQFVPDNYVPPPDLELLSAAGPPPSDPPPPPPPPPPPHPDLPVAVTDSIHQQNLPYNSNINYTSILHAPVFGQGLMGNDTGNGIQITSYDHQTRNGGIISITPNGDYGYFPSQFYYGDNDATTADDFFSYTITDSNGRTATATDAIFITPLQFYIDEGRALVADAQAEQAAYKTLSDKRQLQNDNIFDLATDGLKVLQHEKMLFLGVEALGFAADKLSKLNPAIGVITTAVKLAMTEPTGGETMLTLNSLLTTVVDEYLAGGSAGHTASIVINGLNKTAKTVNGSLDKQNAVNGFNEITDTIAQLTQSRDNAVADMDAITAKRAGFQTAVDNAESYRDAYLNIRDHVLLPS